MEHPSGAGDWSACYGAPIESQAEVVLCALLFFVSCELC
jgi:hypothetical protein